MDKNGQGLAWMARAMALGMLMLVGAASPVQAELDSAGAETVFLIGRGMAARTSADRDRLLQALRRMRDPAAAPIYRHLTEMSDPFRQAHGVLGLVETGITPALALETVTLIDDPRSQAEMVRAALNDQLIGEAQAAQWAASTALATGSRLELARYLLQKGQSVDVAFLREAAAVDDVRHRTFASVLLVQAGDDRALEALRGLASSDEPESQGLCVDALNVAAEGNFDRLGPWALEVYEQPGVDPRIAQPSLGIALRLQAPQAESVWEKAFASDDDPAKQMRLALFALYSAPWVNATLFDPLLASSDQVLQAIGRAGQAVAQKRGVDEAVLPLIQFSHPPLSRWALGYANEQATLPDAQAILLGLILAFDDTKRGPVLENQLEIAIRAAQVLYDRDPDSAVPLLRKVMSNTKSNPLFVRRLLLGLLDCDKPDVYRVVAGLPAFEDRGARLVVLVLMAKSPEPMSSEQLQELALLVRGGGGMREEIRLQAGWTYLKRTNQLPAALDELLR